MPLEGGFNGRTNKVVDSCYSYWIGACFKLINLATNNQCYYEDQMLYNQLKLQMYILLCCQSEDGGLFDKPKKPRDLYHTCYSLSGLSLAQTLKSDYQELFLFENSSNKLMDIDPIYNVEASKLEFAREYFSKLPQINNANKENLNLQEQF
eukprot:TRINITY_DN9342_c0_g1_i1.p2 TRINITY_DN9342_c0_g1~~TRINITY_DN9342_c0_g1_i1.p2  ORF type:complete len:151 (-),score=25.23 TRINITY_DN9342_c0_g1_i1:56-508(-)